MVRYNNGSESNIGNRQEEIIRTLSGNSEVIPGNHEINDNKFEINNELLENLINNRIIKENGDLHKEIQKLILSKNNDLGYYYSFKGVVESKIDQAFQKKIKDFLTDKPISTSKPNNDNHSKGGRNGSTEAPSAIGNQEVENTSDGVSEDITESENFGDDINKKYNLFLSYLDFKGFDKNSSLYKSLEINMKFLKVNPFLTTYHHKSITIGGKKYTYGEFLETFIDKNIYNIIDGKSVSYPNYEIVYDEINKYTDKLKLELNKDKKLDEKMFTVTLQPIDDARDKIRDIQKLNFDNLYKNIDKYLKIDYIDTNFISRQIDIYINTSVGEGKKEGTFAKYLDENKDNITKELSKKIKTLKGEIKQSEILFNEYRKSLIEVKSILDSYEGKVPDNIKILAEEEIKGLVSGMLFINGLHDINYKEVVGLLANNTTLAGLLDYKFPTFGPVLVIGTSVIGITAKFLKKENGKRKFLNILSESGDDTNGIEGKEKIVKKIKGKEKIIERIKGFFNSENVSRNEVNKMVKYLSENGEGEEIKDGYESVKDEFKRLKKFREVQQIISNNSRFEKIRGKLDINSIFLNDKEFARDIISQIIKNDTKLYKTIINKGVNLPKGYFGLGSIGVLFDISGLKPLLLGKNNTHFKGYNAIKSLDNFIADNADKIEDDFDKLKKAKDIFKNSSLEDIQKEKLIEKVDDWSTNDILKDDDKLVEYTTSIENLKNRIVTIVDLSEGDLSKYNASINTEIDTLINKDSSIKNFENDLESFNKKLDSLNSLEKEKSNIDGSLKNILTEKSITDIKFEKLNETQIDEWKGIFSKIVTLEKKLDETNDFLDEYTTAIKDFIKNSTTALNNIDGLISEIEETNKIIKTGNDNIDSKVKSKVGDIMRSPGNGISAISIIIENQKIYLEGSEGKDALSERLNGHELKTEIERKLITSYDNKSLNTLEKFMDDYFRIKSKINISNLFNKNTFINDLKTEGEKVNSEAIKNIENKFDAAEKEETEKKAKEEDEKKAKTKAEENDKDRKSQEKMAKIKAGNGGNDNQDLGDLEKVTDKITVDKSLEIIKNLQFELFLRGEDYFKVGDIIFDLFDEQKTVESFYNEVLSIFNLDNIRNITDIIEDPLFEKSFKESGLVIDDLINKRGSINDIDSFKLEYRNDWENIIKIYGKKLIDKTQK